MKYISTLAIAAALVAPGIAMPKLEARANCNPGNFHSACDLAYANALAINFRKGVSADQLCIVDPHAKNPKFWADGPCGVFGATGSDQVQTAPCGEVQDAIDRIIQGCTVGGMVMGTDYPTSNGELRVELHFKNENT